MVTRRDDLGVTNLKIDRYRFEEIEEIKYLRLKIKQYIQPF